VTEWVEKYGPKKCLREANGQHGAKKSMAKASDSRESGKCVRQVGERRKKSNQLLLEGSVKTEHRHKTERQAAYEKCENYSSLGRGTGDN